MPPSLDALPLLTYYPFDGGPYIASAIVISRDAEYGLNASFHRMMKIDGSHVAIRILERDFSAYIKRGLREFGVCIGNPIQMLIGAAISTKLGSSELDIANALSPLDVAEIGGHTVPTSDIVIIMEFTGDMHDEGPFLDLTETPDIVRSQRVARIKKIYAREGAAFHALLPGGLEHKTLMGMPREPTIFREVGRVCDVKDVYVTPGGTSWLHAAISIKKRSDADGPVAIDAAFRGHRSLKHAFIVDDDIDVHSPAQLEWAMATRFQGTRGLHVRTEKGSSLDPSSDPQTQMTDKVGFDLTIPANRDPADFKKPAPPLKINLRDYLGDKCPPEGGN
jgi:UbiD family decarboxylase